ncbi:MAG: RluA family pseudouridine synthase [Candidatus Izemoplasmatales bacterium]|nr:RluA family pseudouridine synthase [Candidatus Izemoplasmatales bacterium]
MSGVIKHIYEDNHLLVAIKAPGVLSQAGDKPLPDMLSLLKADLKIRHQRPGNVFLGLVHRLDLNVGGIMVFARTSKAAARLSHSIRSHALDKRYLAVVEGRMAVSDWQKVEMVMEKDTQRRVAVSQGDKTGSLCYRVIESKAVRDQWLTLVEVELISGRFHQIRFTLSQLGHPIVNDSKYHAQIKDDDPTLALWAYYLRFPHPITQIPMDFCVKPDGKWFHPFDSVLSDITTRFSMEVTHHD